MDPRTLMVDVAVMGGASAGSAPVPFIALVVFDDPDVIGRVLLPSAVGMGFLGIAGAIGGVAAGWLLGRAARGRHPWTVAALGWPVGGLVGATVGAVLWMTLALLPIGGLRPGALFWIMFLGTLTGGMVLAVEWPLYLAIRRTGRRGTLAAGVVGGLLGPISGAVALAGVMALDLLG